MSQRSLRTVFVYTAHNLGSAIVLNSLKDCHHLDVVGVVRGGHIPSARNGRRRRAKLASARKIGLRYAATLCAYYLTQRTALTMAGLINPWRQSGLLSCEAIARQTGCRRHDTNNVNSEASKDFIRSCDADVVITAFFGQIVQPDTIALPRLGILNLHPGWLPAYQGALSYVWTLANGEPAGGAALHWMDERIDTGPLLARSRVEVEPGATVQSLMAATAQSGAELIAGETARLVAGE
jgi:folate-dependent phosphoribosylglycinamide formyltransferase PurN